MKEAWLMSGAVVPVDVETTAALLVEIKRLIGVVGGMALAQPEQPAPPHDTFDEIAANVFNNAFNKGQGRHSAFKEIAEKIKEMPWENDTKDSFVVWLKEQA